MKFKSIKGTKDILPQESYRWQYVEQTIRSVMHAFNYKEIRTPVFEETALFARGIGELTDIVGKEMYTFQDRSETSLTLKPEMTASVIRAYIQNNLGEQQPLVKVYYLSPMFRQERPQAGRLRQFHQFGAEAIGRKQRADRRRDDRSRGRGLRASWNKKLFGEREFRRMRKMPPRV